MRQVKNSALLASVPLSKGPTAKHFESPNPNLAMTTYASGKGHAVEALITPDEPIKRVHEALHAQSGYKKYPGISRMVVEIVEDCRLHLTMWPWSGDRTPAVIQRSALHVLDAEISAVAENEKAEMFDRFVTALRAAAVTQGAGLEYERDYLSNLNTDQNLFAHDLLHLIKRGRSKRAAELLQAAFSDSEPEPDKEKGGKKKKRSGARNERSSARGSPKIEITTLPLTTPTTAEEDGVRRGPTGHRLNRTELRRPTINPRRLFLRRTKVGPQGTVLFDSSGSMGVSENRLARCCAAAPGATVAYYAGTYGPRGYLRVYAQDGMRAEVAPNEYYGNEVDSLAIDWLMKQEAPRIMVTDREFCGESTSEAQVIRLQNLESQGEVKVYESYDDFMQAYRVGGA